MGRGNEVRSYLNEQYATPGFEVQSGGDTTVTVALSTLTDVTGVVYDLRELFGAECDLEITTTGASLIVYVGRGPTNYNSHFFMCTCIVIAAVVVMAAVYAPSCLVMVEAFFDSKNATTF